MPFITETLWQRLPTPVAAERTDFLAVADWPLIHLPTPVEDRAVSDFDLVRDAVSALRQIRSDYAIPPGKFIDAVISSRESAAIFHSNVDLIGRLAKARVIVGRASEGGGAAHVVITGGNEVIVPLGGIVDLGKECAKLRAELLQLEKQLDALTKRLQNEGFLARAPESVVAAEKAKEQEWTKRRNQIAEKVKALCGG
jgi:valyl-tRNA synthetase